jgi:DNA invertase Pin-like site-specific DNA recombinase
MMFEEKISGTVRDRPELEKLMGHLRKDDILVVARLDRLARSTIELLHIAERIKEKRAELQSLDGVGTYSGSRYTLRFYGVSDGAH